MSARPVVTVAFLALLSWAASAQRDGAEDFEVGRADTGQMPSGKEADGLPDDLVLRNDRVHALVSGAQPFRRANMTTDCDSVLQGCL